MKKALYVGRVLLTALMLVFSLQVFRVFMTTVIWNLTHYLPGPYYLAGFAMVAFAFVLLLPLIQRIAGSRVIIAASGFGIVMMRLAMQFITDPLYLIVLSTTGVIMFLWFFTSWMCSGFDDDGEFPSVMSVGFPSAVVIDTGTRILLMSYDLVWQKISWTYIVVAGASLAALILLWITVVHGTKQEEDGEPGFWQSLLIGGIGPWLYLSMSIYHNPSLVPGFTGLQDIQAQMLVGITLGAGAMIATFLTAQPKKYRFAVSLTLSIILILSTFGIAANKGYSLYTITAGAIALWVLPGFLFADFGKKRKGMYGTSIGMFLGFMAMLVIVFLHANNNIFAVSVAAALIVSAVAVLSSITEIREIKWKSLKIGLIATGLFSVAALTAVDYMAFAQKPPSTYYIFPSRTLRVLTYNIHQGFDADYRMNLDGIIAEIRKLNPDIVCLQEVNRAKISNGMVDCLLPISRALGMPYVFGANHDDMQYGNAVLTKYPIRDWDNLRFFSNSTEPRGTLHAVLKVKQAEDKKSDLNIFVTHLDHIAGPKNVRVKQAAEVLEFWADRPRTIIVGDLNAEPDTPEMKPFYASDLKDALEPSGKKNARTFWEGYGEPSLKLDYVFVSQDLRVTGALIDESRASDHKPVVVEIDR